MRCAGWPLRSAPSVGGLFRRVASPLGDAGHPSALRGRFAPAVVSPEPPLSRLTGAKTLAKPPSRVDTPSFILLRCDGRTTLALDELFCFKLLMFCFGFCESSVTADSAPGRCAHFTHQSEPNCTKSVNFSEKPLLDLGENHFSPFSLFCVYVEKSLKNNSARFHCSDLFSSFSFFSVCKF